jgi:hypothetical protein
MSDEDFEEVLLGESETFDLKTGNEKEEMVKLKIVEKLRKNKKQVSGLVGKLREYESGDVCLCSILNHNSENLMSVERKKSLVAN